MIPLVDGGLVSVHGDLSQGFSADGAGLDVITDAELFGTLKRRGSRLARGRAGPSS